MNSKEDMLLEHPHITLERRLVPFIVASVLFLIFIAFMLGYFLGVKYTTDEFITQIRQETMADQILMSASAASQQTSGVILPQEEVTISKPASEIIAQAPAVTIVTAEITDPTVPHLNSEQPLAASIPEKAAPMRYAAELIGFGTKQAAEEFMHRVSSYSSAQLVLKEHASKSPRGRPIHWYQVVTNTYEQKEELQQLLDLLIKKEHIHDIKIVAYAATKKDLT